MADRSILVAGESALPLDYTVPNAGQIIPKAYNAVFDGSGAAGSFVPTMEIVSEGGIVLSRVPTGTTVVAGDSAEVTFAPFLRSDGAGSGAGITQEWFFGGLGDPTGFTAVPDVTWTKIAFSVNTGPGPGDPALVTFDAATDSVTFWRFPAAANWRWLRFSGLWDVAPGTKYLQLRFTAVGSPGVRLEGGVSPADYKPTSEHTQGDPYHELVTLMTPFSFTAGELMIMTAWAWQNSGGPINFSAGAVEVYGPENAQGPM